MFWSSPPWDEVTYWALDLETGGLDAARDPILSVGMVPVRAGTVRLGEAFETLVRPSRHDAITPESVRAHQLVPHDLSGAPSLFDVLHQVNTRLADGVLLVHNAGIDVKFLRRAHDTTRLTWPKPAVVDTVDLLVRAHQKSRFIDPDQDHQPTLNLSEARRKYGLPDYGAHDALTDAVSTAELFLVLRRVLKARTLRDLR